MHPSEQSQGQGIDANSHLAMERQEELKQSKPTPFPQGWAQVVTRSSSGTIAADPDSALHVFLHSSMSRVTLGQLV